MVTLQGPWTPFSGEEERLESLRRWGLVTPKGTCIPQIMVVDGYFGVPEPCEVVGYQSAQWAVISLPDGLHAIHGEYLAELQPRAMQELPRGVRFADVLADYVVVDIETTGFDRHADEIIEIAAIRYHFGAEAERFHCFVKPSIPIPSNITALTGIRDADVTNAPPIAEAASAFLSFLGDLPMVGHNIKSFDQPFLSAQMGIEFNQIVIDTLPMAREAFPLLSSHKLSYLKDVLELTEGLSHRAEVDVEATNALLWACLSPRRYEDRVRREYLRCLADNKPQQKRSRRAAGEAAPRAYPKEDIKSFQPEGPVDPASPLLGKIVVFTGTLSMSREEAMQAAVNAGAVLKGNVVNKTDYLVIGESTTGTMSGKEKKAAEINQSGKGHVTLLDEVAFTRLLKWKEVPV